MISSAFAGRSTLWPGACEVFAAGALGTGQCAPCGFPFPLPRCSP